MSALLTYTRARVVPTSRKIGFLLGPLLALLVYSIMPDVIPTEASLEAGFESPRAAGVTLALIVLMAVWWMFEVVPLPVTALLPVIVIPLTGINSVGAVTASYGNKVIFLFLGGFLLSVAMQRWNLHKQIALRIVLIFGTEPKRMVFGFMLATMLLGMWISNTATAIMMISIGGSILSLLAAHGIKCSKLSSSLMVGIAYASSISAFGTIIASPPNALLVGYLSDNYSINIGFGEWMLVGVPLSCIFLLIGWYILTHGPFRTPLTDLPGGDDIMRSELEKLGPINKAQRRVIGVFALTIAAWILLPLLWPDSVFGDELVAMIAGVSLFIIPNGGPGEGSLLTWDDTKELPWGILYLFGGGLALASEIQTSGLSGWLAQQLHSLSALPTVLLIIGTCVITMLLTEFMSNTASAATLVPIAAAMAISVGLSPIALALPVTFAASCAFIMPACTPPNAIAVGSGLVKPKEFMRVGWMMSLSGLALISVAVVVVAPHVFGY